MAALVGQLLAVVGLLSLYVATVKSDPVVTLNHGGQIKGLSTTFQNVPVDLFLGVRYAEAPVGKLRFKKPVKATWDGVEDATDVRNECPQRSMSDLRVQARSRSKVQGMTGNEDCLFLYVTVPGGVQKGAKKPVMVWIHGGGYIRGSGISFVGGPLAVFGDVIVVTINYRLGFLGFFHDGPGTGNYGLWDQRAAIIWVKENIAEFGGDPELITIFGEAAGGGSVSAQTLSPHNDGLFQRAIQQSGTLFLPWGWDLEANTQDQMLNVVREEFCKSSDLMMSAHDCMIGVPVEMIMQRLVTASALSNPFKPNADENFFAKDISIHSYKPSRRFDVMSGMNGQEGLVFYVFDTGVYAAMNNKSIEDGMDKEFTKEWLLHKCTTQIAPLSPNLCLEHIMSTYKIDKVSDDKERALRVIEFLGEHNFNHDVMFALEEHSESTKSSYAYYFTEMVHREPKRQLWPLPKWEAKSMADHGDELLFVFATPFLKDEESGIWNEILEKHTHTKALCQAPVDEHKEISKEVIQMWTNFAKSGNPNKPIPLPEGTPTWPQFDKESSLWMEINSNGIQVVTTPNKDRLVRLRQLLHADRQLQHQ